MAGKKTTYLDPDGNQQTGYIIDGKTYTDVAGTQRVPVNSIVTTGDGAYILTENGGMKYSDYLDSQQSDITGSGTQTTYLDPAGNQQTGYIIDGKTYTDEAGTQRVPVGSVVTTGDGAYILTEIGGMKYSDYLDSQESGITGNSGSYTAGQQSNIDRSDVFGAATEAEIQALDAAYQANLNTLDWAEEAIPGQYRTARNAAAAQSNLSQSAFNEYAAAAGLNSGAGGQAALAQSNMLQGNLSNISQAESDALSDLDLQRTQLMTAYENDIAQAIADGELAEAEALYNEAVRADEAAYNQKLLEQNQQSINLGLYQILASIGDFSWLSKLSDIGYTDEEITAIEAQFKALYGIA